MAITMTNVVLSCHSSRGLSPYRVLGRNQSTTSVDFSVLSWVFRPVITLDKHAQATFGIFFCCQEKQLRVSFDTTCVNVLFLELDHTALPTASSFSRMEALPGSELFISHGDLESASYKLRGFPRLSDSFVMPLIKARALGICELHRNRSIPTLQSRLILPSLPCCQQVLVHVGGPFRPSGDRRTTRQASRDSPCLMRTCTWTMLLASGSTQCQGFFLWR